MFDLGVHPIAIAMLAARSKVVSVSATLEGAADHPTDEHAELTLSFDRGLDATVVSSWRGGEVPEWSVQAASTKGAVRAELLPNLLLEHNGEEIAIAPAMLTPGGNRFGLPAFYSLHAWIWKFNPSGTFAMWNPQVHCPA